MIELTPEQAARKAELIKAVNDVIKHLEGVVIDAFQDDLDEGRAPQSDDFYLTGAVEYILTMID